MSKTWVISLNKYSEQKSFSFRFLPIRRRLFQVHPFISTLNQQICIFVQIRLKYSFKCFEINLWCIWKTHGLFFCSWLRYFIVFYIRFIFDPQVSQSYRIFPFLIALFFSYSILENNHFWNFILGISAENGINGERW